jgi:hypothetical protein
MSFGNHSQQTKKKREKEKESKPKSLGSSAETGLNKKRGKTMCPIGEKAAFAKKEERENLGLFTVSGSVTQISGTVPTTTPLPNNGEKISNNLPPHEEEEKKAECLCKNRVGEFCRFTKKRGKWGK